MAQPQPTAPAVDEEMLETLVAISGKPRDLCVRALQASNNNPDLAFEILASGMIPAAGGQPGGMQQPVEDFYGEEDASADTSGVGADMAAFFNNPQFAQIRQRILQNPQFYNEFMQMMQTQQPQLYAAIQANPMAFMNLLLSGGQGVPGAGAGQPRPQAQHPGAIQVTREEMESIQRLQALGFTQARAAQAYFAMDKNEEFAANFLFEQAAEDDETAL